MDLSRAMEWASRRRNGVLITIRADGRPQSSDIVYNIDGNVVRVSVTATRAKTANMRRDPRVVLHLTDTASWSYVSFDSTVELSPVCADPTDAVADESAELYRAITGSEHPDWDEYRQSLVDEGRLVARITPLGAVGQIHSAADK